MTENEIIGYLTEIYSSLMALPRDAWSRLSFSVTPDEYAALQKAKLIQPGDKVVGMKISPSPQVSANPSLDAWGRESKFGH
jgi:hypothetical protein